MTERTFTKGEIMEALNKLKTPDPNEGRFGPLNETDLMRVGIAGAESLADAILGGAEPRRTFKNNIVKTAMQSMFSRTMERLGIDSDISSEAERITTPPRGE